MWGRNLGGVTSLAEALRVQVATSSTLLAWARGRYRLGRILRRPDWSFGLADGVGLAYSIHGRTKPLLRTLGAMTAYLSRPLPWPPTPQSFTVRAFGALMEIYRRLLRDTRTQWVAGSVLQLIARHQRPELATLVPGLIRVRRSFCSMLTEQLSTSVGLQALLPEWLPES
jgi:hypothetical protein